jgi:putative transposase
MRYRRSDVLGASYFFTVVTYGQQPLLARAEAVATFERALQTVQQRRSFVLEAQVVLPDHLHALWTLPDNDSDYPTRWRLIKEAFTREYVTTNRVQEPDSRRRARGERAVWQRRYWEHLIRDDHDFSAHVEYIHYNPVRHGLVKAPADWPHSTFLDWVARGNYERTWGSDEMPKLPRLVGRE